MILSNNLLLRKKDLIFVTPAKAGVQDHLKYWVPAFAGMTQETIFVCRFGPGHTVGWNIFKSKGIKNYG